MTTRAASWLTVVALLTWGAPGPTRAQVAQSVRLTAPECAALPFQTDRLRALLALELSVDGAVLVESEESVADALVRYRAEPCEPGATDFAIEVTLGGISRTSTVALADVPLASVPRALALEIIETLAGRTGGPPITIPDPESESESEPEPAPEALAAVEVPAPAEPETEENPFRLGFAFHFRNTPDTGGTLAGTRLFLDLPLGHDLPLALRLDATGLLGPAPDLMIGWIEGGVTVSFWTRADDVVAVRFGPRLFVGHGSGLDLDPMLSNRVSETVQVGISVVLAAEVLLAECLELLLEADVGTNLHGLEYAIDGTRTGFLGAFWGFSTALAFRP